MARPAFSPAQRLEIAERDGWVCNTANGDGCGKPVAKNRAWQADHSHPVGLDGPNTVENGQLLCWECHRAKTDKTDVPMIAKGKRMRDTHEAHEEARRRGERRQSKKEMRIAAIKANAPEPVGGSRQTVEGIDG